MKNKITEEEKLFFFYTKEQIKHKGKIVERRVSYAALPAGRNSLRIGKATCSLSEQFSKKKGRSIARCRAILRPLTILYLQDDTTPVKQFIAEVTRLTKKY